MRIDDRSKPSDLIKVEFKFLFANIDALIILTFLWYIKMAGSLSVGDMLVFKFKLLNTLSI